MSQVRTLNYSSYAAGMPAVVAIVVTSCLLAEPLAGQQEGHREQSTNKSAAVKQQQEAGVDKGASSQSPTAAQQDQDKAAGESKRPQPRGMTSSSAEATVKKQQKEGRQSLEEQLLQSLESVMELDAIRPDSPAAAAQPSPLILIGQQMKLVERRLQTTNCGPDTQKVQEQIVAALDELIKGAEQRAEQGGGSCSACHGAGCAKYSEASGKPSQAGRSNKPLSDSVSSPNAPLSVKKPDDRNATIIRAIWGHLPERLRDELQQVFKEKMLPSYEELIRLYFRTLAEQAVE